MKKIILLFIVSLVFIPSLQAQITQGEADEIVKERLYYEVCNVTIHSNDNLQENFNITTSTGETIELEYPCWVYFAKYAGTTNHKYLIVKESDGNLLEVNALNDGGPNNLETWRFIQRVISFMDYPLSETMCIWANYEVFFDMGDEVVVMINNNEELEQYVSCAEASYPEIDFSKHTLLLVSRWWGSLGPLHDSKLSKTAENQYNLDLFLLSGYTVNTYIFMHFQIAKIPPDVVINLNLIH